MTFFLISIGSLFCSIIGIQRQTYATEPSEKRNLDLRVKSIDEPGNFIVLSEQ
jgi:hypothetical protein